jgi:hypothetical protein
MRVKRHERNRANIPAIKDCNDKLITDSIEQSNSLNAYYAFYYSCERNNPQIQSTELGTFFIISTNIIGKRLSVIGRKKSVGPDGIPGKILKLVGEDMILYLAKMQDITYLLTPWSRGLEKLSSLCS